MSSLCTEKRDDGFCCLEAVVEKWCRSVCRRHADELNGVEYPVRPSSWVNDRDLETDLDMIEQPIEENPNYDKLLEDYDKHIL